MYDDLEHKLNYALRTDPVYQQLLAECHESEADYLRIRDQLSPENQTILERYLSAGEEADHRKLSLLFEIASSLQASS